MPDDRAEWKIEFQGCTEKDPDCTCGVFAVSRAGGPSERVEVLTTLQIERLLAKETGREGLSDDERSLVIRTAGRQLIEDCIARAGRPLPQLYLTGQIFRSRGAQRRLLQDSGLAADTTPDPA